MAITILIPDDYQFATAQLDFYIRMRGSIVLRWVI